MTTVPFSFRIDPKTKARLEREAARENRSASYLAQQAIASYLDRRLAKRKALKEAVAEADKGILISEAAMDAWVDSWGTGQELPPPEPDIFPSSKKTA